MNAPPLIEKTPKPLYLVPQHGHQSLRGAYSALECLAAAYPAVRFGLFRNGGKWLVFRVHEQHQQAAREAHQTPNNGGGAA